MSQNYFKLTSLLLICVHTLSYGQDESEHIQLVNTGLFSVRPETILSTQLDFTNTASGTFVNDGSVYYYKDFTNDGYYGISSSMKSSSTFFILSNSTQAKRITGNSLASFYNIEFDSELNGNAFDLKNNIDISGLAHFKNGIVKVDPTKNTITSVSNGMVTFLAGARHENVGNHSYIEGAVEKKGNDRFEYPIGHKEYFRPAVISAPDDVLATIVGQYYLEDAPFFTAHKKTTGVIKVLNEKEYWRLEGNLKQPNMVVLSLDWNEETTPPELLKNPEEELHIVRWDAKQQLWVDEGGVVDMSLKRVTTVAEIKDFGYFTLATVKKDWIIEGDVVIYNLVTPDGDGKNDYFIIDNINKYPNNRVEIYNRWGVKVYETTGYDPKGDGSTNVFRGYSDGKITVDKNKKLPSGTYYYVVTYEYKDANGNRMIKKAANLHVETN
ncbi:gliding motility-associated C-terminal domain-containing protein [Myroides odoratus]|uniref:gliding motility-associated C-terminal domain-containing protein n=1 Tax=Myroides odoratus TaxID=256 RepID=UPI000765E834|nr:gliding motility-associated C-terminal domain-containing protein [Myroides odoratus]